MTNLNSLALMRFLAGISLTISKGLEPHIHVGLPPPRPSRTEEQNSETQTAAMPWAQNLNATPVPLGGQKPRPQRVLEISTDLGQSGVARRAIIVQNFRIIAQLVTEVELALQHQPDNPLTIIPLPSHVLPSKNSTSHSSRAAPPTTAAASNEKISMSSQVRE